MTEDNVFSSESRVNIRIGARVEKAKKGISSKQRHLVRALKRHDEKWQHLQIERKMFISHV